MEGKERAFPFVPPLLHLRFAVPIRKVVRELIGQKEGVHGEVGEPIVGDWQEGTCGLFLGLLHCHDLLWHAGVVGPVAWKFPDESDDVGDSKASDLVRKVIEEGERQHHFVVSVVVVEGDVVHLLDGMEDELTASMIGGADAILVAEAVGPQGLIFVLLPHVGFRIDRLVLFVEGVFVIVERLVYPQLSEVDVVDKDEAGDFSWFLTGEADLQAYLEEDFPGLLKVVVLWRTNDEHEGCDCSLKFSGDVQC